MMRAKRSGGDRDMTPIARLKIEKFTVTNFFMASSIDNKYRFVKKDRSFF